MNNNFKFLVQQSLKSCFYKYIACFILAILLLIISRKTTGIFQDVILNITGGLFSLPIIFLSYDVYDTIRTRKQREIVINQLNSKIETLFINFIFATNKLRHDFEDALQANPQFLEARNSELSQIFDEISSTKHRGFFVFSYFDNFSEQISDILESQLFMNYAPNNIISLISEFSWCYLQLLDEFKLITKDDFILINSDSSIEFAVSERTQSEYKTYEIFQNINGDRHVLYIANYPIFDEDMLKGIYRISGTQAKTLADLLYRIYSLINKWEHISQRTLSIDNIFISSGRLCENSYVNMHAKNNICINIQWP